MLTKAGGAYPNNAQGALMRRSKDLSPREVAEELSLAYDTVLRLCREGIIPAYRAGEKKWRIKATALDDYKLAGLRRQGRPAAVATPRRSAINNMQIIVDVPKGKHGQE
jgi:excisionase family DNA binding protein